MPVSVFSGSGSGGSGRSRLPIGQAHMPLLGHLLPGYSVITDGRYWSSHASLLVSVLMHFPLLPHLPLP